MRSPLHKWVEELKEEREELDWRGGGKQRRREGKQVCICILGGVWSHMVTMAVNDCMSKMPFTLPMEGTLRETLLMARWTEWWVRGWVGRLRSLNWDLREEI